MRACVCGEPLTVLFWFCPCSPAAADVTSRAADVRWKVVFFFFLRILTRCGVNVKRAPEITGGYVMFTHSHL